MKSNRSNYRKRSASVLLLMLLSICSYTQNPSDKVLEIMNLINFAYVDSADMDHLSEVAIVSMLADLDPHSVYIPKEQVQEMNESLNGSFDGIGIQFEILRDTVFVISTIPGGPSEKLGIQSGDKIVTVGGQLTSGVEMTDEKIIALLRGKKGSQVTINIKRTGIKEHMEYSISRDKIPINSVDASFMVNENIGYIKINRFAKTTHREFEDAFNKLEKNGMKSMILDLRDNGGGYLYSAVQLTDEFLNGKNVIVTTKGLKQSEQEFKAKKKGMFTSGKLVVLIDEGTASASEILAGAIQDWDRGIILGRRSFGKGLVMKPYTLSDGSMVRLTTSRYYTPSGRCIQKDYSKSKEIYNDEIYNRYENGELFSLDSINFPHELKFTTMNGRTVYGGGGILPDIFFPADTLLLGDRYQNILNNGNLIEFTLDYTDRNRDSLRKSYKDEIALINDRLLSEKLINEISESLKMNGVINHSLDQDINLPLSSQLKAFIAKYLWGNNSYFKVISYDQEILNKAINTIDNWEINWARISERGK